MTLEKKQSIINSIMQKEISGNNLSISGYSFGRIGYFNSKYFKNKLKTSKIMEILMLALLPQVNGVSRKKAKEIIVFFNDVSTPLFNDSIIRLLKTTYHELYHAIDDTREKETQITYNNFANDCDRFIIKHSPLEICKYLLTPSGHDSFMFEILANIHGINKTEQYIKENNIQCNSYELRKFAQLKNKYQLQYQNYNLTKRLDLIISEYKTCIKCKDFDKTVFELFINENGIIKDINTVFMDDNVLNLDCKILAAFINCKKIKEAIKNTQLTEHTSFVLNEILTKGSITTEEGNINNKTI